MNYWNKDNFEGLKSIGEKFSSIEGYELFGRYCLQKESGYKKLANVAIEQFVAIAKTKPLGKQRETAVELSFLQLDPNDDICMSKIAQAYISDLDYQIHHLSKSLFLGDLDHAKKSLAFFNSYSQCAFALSIM